MAFVVSRLRELLNSIELAAGYNCSRTLEALRVEVPVLRGECCCQLLEVSNQVVRINKCETIEMGKVLDGVLSC